MPSSSLFLRSGATLVSVLSLLTASSNAYSSNSYTLDTSYAGDSFFDGFDFFTDADPTHGFVTYVDESTAKSSGLIKSGTDGSVIIGVDANNTYDSTQPYYNINGVGRPSVRITSTKKYNHGLFIADIANMPGGVCGTWPAFWTLGDGTWPYHGEIDILEGADEQTADLSALHTAGQCSIAGDSRTETGALQATNCTYDVNTGANGAGCGVSSTDTNSYGLDFNSNDGGVYAMQWTSDYIKIWFFERGSIPQDIKDGTPSPDGWGLPTSNFQGDCDIDSNFLNHQIVIDATFCGDWAGSIWSNTCAASTGYSSCAAYVGDNPSAFTNMYWDINSINVYQLTTPSNYTTTTTPTTTPTTTTTSGGCPEWTDGCTPPAYLTNLPSSIQAELPAWTGMPPPDWCSYTSWMQSYTSANSVYASCSAKAASNSSYYTCTAPTQSYATPTGNATTTGTGGYTTPTGTGSYTTPTGTGSYTTPTGTGSYTTPTATDSSTGTGWSNDPTGVTYSGSLTTDFSLTTAWAQSSIAAPPLGGDGNCGGTISVGGTVYSWGSATATDPATKTTGNSTTSTWGSWSDPSSYTSTTSTWGSWSDPSSYTSTASTWASWSDPTSYTSTTSTWGSWSDPTSYTSTTSTWGSWTTASSTTTPAATYSKTSWTYDPASSSAYWALAGSSLASPNTWTTSSTSSVVYAAAATSTGSGLAWDPTSTGAPIATFTGAASSVSVAVMGYLAMIFVGILMVM